MAKLSILLVLFICWLPVSSKADNDKSKRTTFNGDIAPIIFEKCSSCHREGQSGPFSLLTYKDVRKRARTIQAVIENGYMPPWKPVNESIEFANDRRLKKRQIQLFTDWINDGKPEGHGPPAVAPKFNDDWRLGAPDMVIEMADPYKVPASGPDIYRSFVFPIQSNEDRWLKAIEYRPTAQASVHHALFFVDDSGSGRRMDGLDGQPGIAGMSFLDDFQSGSSGEKSKQSGLKSLFEPTKNPQKTEGSLLVSNAFSRGLGGYVPGSTPVRLPRDLAMLLPKNSDIIMQTHFHPSGKLDLEQGKLGLYFASKPPSQILVPIQLPPMFGFGSGIKIPAGESNYVVRDSFKIPVDIQLISIGAHAHYICRSVSMKAKLPNRDEMTLLEIDDWDLDWQDRYYFKNPPNLPAGTELLSELVYDNSRNNPENPFDPPREIRWGRQSEDEMGSVTIHAVTSKKDDQKKLETALAAHFVDSLRSGDVVSLLMQLDTNRDNGLQKTEAPPRLVKRFEILDRNRDGKVDRSELHVIRKFWNSISKN